MILITGGAWQGKRSFAKSLAPHVTNGSDILVSDGMADPFETAFHRPVIGSFHYFVRRLLEEREDVSAFITEIETRNREAVITSDEMGCGIVPASAFERAWREAAGRAAVKLAADSDAVYRMVCGIAVQIK